MNTDTDDHARKRRRTEFVDELVVLACSMLEAVEFGEFSAGRDAVALRARIDALWAMRGKAAVSDETFAAVRELSSLFVTGGLGVE